MVDCDCGGVGGVEVNRFYRLYGIYRIYVRGIGVGGRLFWEVV